MKANIALLYYRIRTGFWFLPTVITLAAIGLSQILLYVDREAPSSWLKELGGLLEIGPQGSQLLMSTIARSMMTVTSLVFSMTLVALTMTSSQFGPRLLTHFMRDRVTQLVLATFLATFVYALITMGSIEKANEGNFVPHLSVTAGMVLAIANFCILIYFIHHIASSIQADSVIARVTRDLFEAIRNQFDEIIEEDGTDGTGAEEREAKEPPKDGTDICGASDGYVQAVDHESLLSLAAENDLEIYLKKRAGHFVIRDEPIAVITRASKAGDEIKAEIATAIRTGETPTMVQDPEYAMNALVEVALRALSPGINDPHTALICIDNITGALAEALKRKGSLPVLCDEEGTPRFFLQPLDFNGFLKTAFDEIRQTATGNVAVNIRLTESLIRLAPLAQGDRERAALKAQMEMIDRSCENAIQEPNDRSDIRRRIKDLEEILAQGEAA